MPEVDLVDRTIELAQILLKERGFLPGKDFIFKPREGIYLSEQAKTELFKSMLPGDLLMIEEILAIHNYG